MSPADIDPNLSDPEPPQNGRVGCFVLACLAVFFLLVWLVYAMFEAVP